MKSTNKQADEKARFEEIKYKPIWQLSTDEIELYLKHEKKYDTGQIARFFEGSPEKFGKLFAYLDEIADRCSRLEKTEERFVERVSGVCNPPFYGYYKWNGTAALFYYLTKELNGILEPQWDIKYKWNVYLYVFGYPYDFEQMKYAVKNNSLGKPRGYKVLDSILQNTKKIFH